MSFSSLLKNRRSVRQFMDQPIEHEKIILLEKALLLSPTGKRKNHWEFVFVDNKEQLEQLSMAKEHGSALLKGAALGVVVIGDTGVSDTWIEDCSIASAFLQMQAEELDLGSCWVQIHKRLHNAEKTAEEYVKTLLQIPENKSVLSIIALGYPTKKRAPLKDSDLLYDKIHKGKY